MNLNLDFLVQFMIDTFLIKINPIRENWISRSYFFPLGILKIKHRGEAELRTTCNKKQSNLKKSKVEKTRSIKITKASLKQKQFMTIKNEISIGR